MELEELNVRIANQHTECKKAMAGLEGMGDRISAALIKKLSIIGGQGNKRTAWTMWRTALRTALMLGAVAAKANICATLYIEMKRSLGRSSIAAL